MVIFIGIPLIQTVFVTWLRPAYALFLPAALGLALVCGLRPWGHASENVLLAENIPIFLGKYKHPPSLMNLQVSWTCMLISWRWIFKQFTYPQIVTLFASNKIGAKKTQKKMSQQFCSLPVCLGLVLPECDLPGLQGTLRGHDLLRRLVWNRCFPAQTDLLS